MYSEILKSTYFDLFTDQTVEIIIIRFLSVTMLQSLCFVVIIKIL